MKKQNGCTMPEFVIRKSIIQSDIQCRDQNEHTSENQHTKNDVSVDKMILNIQLIKKING